MFAPFAFRQEPPSGGGGTGGWVTDSLWMYIDPATSTITGTSISDLSGNGRSSTLVGGLGVSGGYFRFTNSAYYISSPINFPQAQGDAWSVEIWMKLATTSFKSGNPCLYSGFNPSGNEPGLQIQINNSNQFGFEYRRIGSQVDGTDSAAANDATWHQWVFTKAAYPNASGVNFYKDKVAIITRAALANTTDPGLATGYMMGRDVNGGEGWTDAYGGLIRFYTKALSSAEVTQNYDANKAAYGL